MLVLKYRNSQCSLFSFQLVTYPSFLTQTHKLAFGRCGKTLVLMAAVLLSDAQGLRYFGLATKMTWLGPGF